MGLRINHNIDAMRAQTALGRNNLALSKSLNKLSTGYRINVAADGPAELVISEQLRAQMTGITQAVENSEQAINLITTAEGALSEINSILNSIRQLGIHASNTGTVDEGQVAADQAQIDSAVRSIDRIVNTTKYGKKYLLNGAQDYLVNNTNTNNWKNIKVNRLNFAGAQSQSIDVFQINNASQALVTAATGSDATTSVTFAISGLTGTDYISLSGQFSLTQMSVAINSLTPNTGVEMLSTTGAVYSTEYGSNAFVRVKLLKGSYGVAGYSDYGANAVVTANGQLANGQGLKMQVDSSLFNLSFELSTSVGINTAVGTVSVFGGGMNFQLGDYTNPNEQEAMGIAALHSTALGHSDIGFLSEIRTGGQYDLKTEPGQSVKIIDEAINQVSTLRAKLGAFQMNTLETNINSLNVSLENISASESRIRDANMAYETTQYTKNQILVQSSTSILAQANMASQNVLQLLQ